MEKQDQKLSRMERKKIEMRKNIIDTTISLIELKGFEATTMEEIAKEADIAKGTLYNYYSEKEAIISDYINQAFEAKNDFRLEQLEKFKNTHDRMVYITNNLMRGIKEKKEIFEKYLVYIMKQVVSFDRKEVERSGIEELILAIIDLGKKEGDICGDLPLVMIVDFFIFIIISTAKQFYINPEGYNQKEVVEKNVNIFVNGIKPTVE